MKTTLKTSEVKPSRERKISKSPKKSTTTTRMKRPQHSEWKSLVMKALQSGPTTGMTLKEVYDFVKKKKKIRRRRKRSCI